MPGHAGTRRGRRLSRQHTLAIVGLTRTGSEKQVVQRLCTLNVRAGSAVGRRQSSFRRDSRPGYGTALGGGGPPERGGAGSTT